MRRIVCLLPVFISLFLSSCGGGGDSNVAATAPVPLVAPGSPAASPTSPAAPVAGSIAPPVLPLSGYPGDPVSCTVAGQKLWLDAYMADQYFWSANRPAPNSAAANADAYFRSQLFVPTDRYSFSQELAQFTQFFSEGTRTGYGYSLAFADSTQTKLQIRTVEPLSPVAAAGLQRGDTILSIDGFSPSNVASGSLTAVTTSGITRSFSIQTVAGTTRSFNVVSRNFVLSPVLNDSVLTAATGAKVGYVAYQDFTSSSLTALGAAFNRFRSAGVTELIVDLRYNGGGSVTVARALASMIGGAALEGKVFAKIRFNAQNRASDFDYAFVSTRASLPALPLEGLTRVFFITSPGTASASELVVNSLYPFKRVVTIGGTTFGKPFGFQPRSACDTVYNAVNFETFNAADSGRFTSGLPANCSVADDLNKALGDPTEKRIAAALGYVQSESCPAAAAKPAFIDLQATKLNDSVGDINRAQAATSSVATPRFMEPAFGELNRPRMIAD